MFGSCLSIANVCTQLGRVLTNCIPGLALYNFEKNSFFDPSLEQYAFIDIDAPVGFFYGIPDQIPESFFQHPFTIGGFVCETNRVHNSWTEMCNKLDLVIVPSTFCQQALYRSGVITPVMVVPHGLEPEYAPLITKERSEPFIFYNTFDSGSFTKRKSAEELVRCFLDAFDRRPGIVLRLRTQLSPDIVSLQQRYDFGSVIWIDQINAVSTKDFARIYSEVHCTVHPSKGEGFGLIPFQSIACETPVIAPYSTGMADYLNDSNAMCVRVGPSVEGEGVGNQAGTYFSVDERHLTELLRYAFDNWEGEYEKLVIASPSFRSRYSWEKVLAGLVDTLNRIIGSENLDVIRRDLADELL